MRSTPIALLFVIATSACGGGDDSAAPDASTAPDAELVACTGMPYDHCEDTVGWTDCLDGMECRLFGMQGFTLCAPACDATTPCPDDQDGVAVPCNMMGRCRPDQANACFLP